jgi:branched-chain amino acid transport system substrate-binding protein
MRIKPTARAFYEAFAVKYPMLLVAPQYAPEAYDATNLLLEAMRRAGDVDRGKVLKELQNIGTYQGSVGEIRFDEKGDLVDADIGLYQCIDGLRNYIGSLRDLIKT